MRRWRKWPRSAWKIGSRLADSAVCFSHAHLLRNIVESHEYELETREPGDRDLVAISFRPTGGLGDYIICSKLLDELMTCIPCRVDVYCEHLLFGQAVYGGRPGVRVVPANHYEDRRFKYDLALLVEHFIHVERINANKIALFNPELVDRLNELVREYFTIYPDVPEQWYREALHFMRCRVKGIDRWTELRHEHIFKIADHRTWIPLNPEYKKRLADLGLAGTRYVTFNRGADSMGRSGMQTKVWPQEHYEALAGLLKTAFPDIKIVQVGGKKNTKIRGADLYVFGENLEVTKWILKESLLHVDCEGGLTHLATQLSTKCLVLFGPTPVHFYGYPQNINLSAGPCGNCMGLHKDWAFTCFKGHKEAECMKAVTPEMAFEAAEAYLKAPDSRVIPYREISIVPTEKMSDEEQKLAALCSQWTDRYQFLSLKPTRLPWYAACLRQLKKEKDLHTQILLTGLSNDPFPLVLASLGYDQITVTDSNFGYTGEPGDTTHCLYMRLCAEYGIDARLGDERCQPVEWERGDVAFRWKERKTNDNEVRYDGNSGTQRFLDHGEGKEYGDCF